MTIKDPIIHLKFGKSEIAVTGTADDYAIRSNNKEFTKIVKQRIKHSVSVRYGDLNDNVYMTGDSSIEQLFISLVSLSPDHVIIIEDSESIDKNFWKNNNLKKEEDQKMLLNDVDNFVETDE